MRIKIHDKKKFMKLFNNIFPENKISNINGISIDSRNIQENDIFIPLKGKNHDGNDFINEVLVTKGTICLYEGKSNKNRIIPTTSNKKIISKFASIWRKNINSKIIAITGSNGKTTTKELLYHILNKKFKCGKSTGNHNSTIGLPLSFLKCMLDEEFTILELGANKPGEIKELCNIFKPNYSLITNISNAHIKNYDSLGEITKNKADIFHFLENNQSIAFINTNDDEITKIPLKCKNITYGINNPKAKFNGIIINNNILQINDFNLELDNKIAHLKDMILSVYAISNTLGVSSIDFQKYLRSFSLIGGRGNIIFVNGYQIIDDAYNANPASMYLGLNRLHGMKNKNNKILIIGDMLELGNSQSYEHEKLGKYINNLDYKKKHI